MYENSAPIDPYADSAYVAPAAPASEAPPPSSDRDAPRGRSRSRSPARYRSPGARSNGGGGGYRRRSPAPRRPNHAPIAPNPSSVLGVFGLSIRTAERDLEDEFSRFGRVEKVTIVYDQRQSDRSRGFGFITMGSVEDATRCVQELNGIDLNGRRIRVDYSVTERPHAPTPGEYMGLRRSGYDSHRDSHRGGGGGGGGGSHRGGGGHHDRHGGDRDHYGRDSRDWRDRRSPPPARGGGGRYSPRRRSYSRSPPRGGSPPHSSRRDYDDDRAPRW